jgi:hypothetical protein
MDNAQYVGIAPPGNAGAPGNGATDVEYVMCFSERRHFWFRTKEISVGSGIKEVEEVNQLLI